MAVAMLALLAVAITPALGAAGRALDVVGETFFDVPAIPEVDEPAQRSVLYAADGTRLGFLVGEQNRDLVSLDEIAPAMVDAVVATEDETFFDHVGVNPKATLRALLANVSAGEVEEGGSTITQQYVKNALLTPEQTLERKVREAVYAVEIEERLSKEEILERYLNIAYFGNGAYGVEAAAERYFSKDAAELTLAEAAMLAGSIRAPEALNPIDAPDRAAEMRDLVVGQMLEQGRIGEPAAERALAVDVRSLLDPRTPPPPRYPFFIEHVKEQLLAAPELGDTRAERAEALYAGGLRITTTLLPDLQTAARETIAERLEDPAADPLAGLATVEPDTGRIRVLAVGPKTFGECEAGDDACATTKVNPLVPGLGGSGRQVGSAFKPILDAAALESGIDTSWEARTRSGREIEGCIDYVDGEETLWTPENYSLRGAGVLDMPEAIRRSNNVYHAALIAEVGPSAVVETARDLGIGTEIPERCAIALGAASVFPIDMAEAFATLGNGGVRCTPYAVEEVTTASGDVVLDPEPSCEQVIAPETADTMVTMMREVVERGTATRAQVSGWDIAGKTGTTNDFRDAWFVGITDPLVTAAWVGFEAPREMVDILGYRRVAGGTVPAEIWQGYMEQALGSFETAPLPTVDLDRGDGDPTDNGDAGPDIEPTPDAPAMSQSAPSDRPDPSPTPTETASPTPSPTATGGPVDDVTEPVTDPTPSESPSSEPSPTPTGSETSEPEPSPTSSETSEPEPTPTSSETSEPEPTPTSTETSSPDPTPTGTEPSEPEPTPTSSEPSEPEPTPTASEAG